MCLYTSEDHQEDHQQGSPAATVEGYSVSVLRWRCSNGALSSGSSVRYPKVIFSIFGQLADYVSAVRCTFLGTGGRRLSCGTILGTTFA